MTQKRQKNVYVERNTEIEQTHKKMFKSYNKLTHTTNETTPPIILHLGFIYIFFTEHLGLFFVYHETLTYK